MKEKRKIRQKQENSNKVRSSEERQKDTEIKSGEKVYLCSN